MKVRSRLDFYRAPSSAQAVSKPVQEIFRRMRPRTERGVHESPRSEGELRVRKATTRRRRSLLPPTTREAGNQPSVLCLVLSGAHWSARGETWVSDKNPNPQVGSVLEDDDAFVQRRPPAIGSPVLTSGYRQPATGRYRGIRQQHFRRQGLQARSRGQLARH